MSRLLRLQLVFWLNIIPGIVSLLIIVIASNLKDIPLRVLAIVSRLLLALHGLSSISLYCHEATILSFSSISFSLMSPSFFFLPILFFGFFGLGSLFDQVGFILTLTLGSRAGF